MLIRGMKFTLFKSQRLVFFTFNHTNKRLSHPSLLGGDNMLKLGLPPHRRVERADVSVQTRAMGVEIRSFPHTSKSPVTTNSGKGSFQDQKAQNFQNKIAITILVEKI